MNCTDTVAVLTAIAKYAAICFGPFSRSKAALFCCNAKKDDKAIQQMKEALTAVGVKVLPQTYVCSGKGFLGGKHPSEEELKGAAKWAKECAAKVSE